MTAKVESDREIQSASQIEDYLLENPSFFLGREHLLAEMMLPHEAQGAVSLVERQVNLLRERNIDSRKRLNQFIATAKENDELYKKTKGLILDLMDADSLQSLVKTFHKSASHLFSIDAAQILLHQTQFVKVTNVDKISNDQIERSAPWLTKATDSMCGQFRDEECKLLFPHGRSIKSAVVFPLRYKNSFLGVLSFGSQRANYFDSKMDVLFIEFIADVVSRQLDRLA
ncbi:MAG: DUF484 family protein [Cellvibrionales bacterium]|nr:DUF484 family protein [Cellvibrionales bacterium]